MTLIEANIAMLDELFKSSSELLNSMLGALSQSRNVYLKGIGEVKLPLIAAFVISNEFPSDNALDPFDDRLIFRYEVLRIQKDENMKKMLTKDFDTTNDFSIS